MAVKNLWTNADGLVVKFGLERVVDRGKTRRVVTAGEDQELRVQFTYNDLPYYNKDANNDGTLDAFESVVASIPAGPDGVYLKSATLFAVEDWATANSAVLNLDLYKEDGTAMATGIGIDEAIAASALDTGDVVSCNGSLVGTTLAAATAPYYVGATITVGSFTTGKAELVLVYRKLGFPETAPSTGTVTVS
jgi:hypothetical protein